MRRPIALLFCCLPAFAQEQDIQKQLIQRQQQSDAFTLQLRQSQEALGTPSGRRGILESRQFSERLRLDNVSARQLREVQPDIPHIPQSLRPIERQRAEEERRPLTVTAGGIVLPFEPPR